jgi:hypothetical protein
MLPSVYSGARCVVSINGKTVAAGFVADYTIETRATEIDAIDQVTPVELAPDRIRVAMNLRIYRTPDNDPILGGIAPGSASLGQSEQKAFTQSKYLYIEIKDTNDVTVMHIPKAWLVRRTGQLTMGDLMTESWSIIGMQYLGPQG